MSELESVRRALAQAVEQAAGAAELARLLVEYQARLDEAARSEAEALTKARAAETRARTAVPSISSSTHCQTSQAQPTTAAAAITAVAVPTPSMPAITESIASAAPRAQNPANATARGAAASRSSMRAS